jgi:5'-nucleotidase
LILLTNDDGIDAPGIKVMREYLEDLDEVRVVAPMGEMSGVSHSVTLEKPIEVKWLGDRTAAVTATPTDCVLLALHGILEKKPAIVISGINLGPNLGNDVTYSGTVAAALEAAIHGVKAMAISLATRKDPDFEPAARFGRKLAEYLLNTSLAPGVFLNVNVPKLDGRSIRGVRVTRLGRRVYRDDIVKISGFKDRVLYKIGGEPVCHMDEGTDVQALEENFISVTPLSLDLTHQESVSELKGLEELGEKDPV